MNSRVLLASCGPSTYDLLLLRYRVNPASSSLAKLIVAEVSERVSTSRASVDRNLFQSRMLDCSDRYIMTVELQVTMDSTRNTEYDSDSYGQP